MMNIETDEIKEKQLFSQKLSSPKSVKKEKPKQSIRCCTIINGWMGSTLSQDHHEPTSKSDQQVKVDPPLALTMCHHQSTIELEEQVAELEIEIQRLRGLKDTYRAKLERVQAYLRHCLQIAQEKGLLDYITNNNSDCQQPCTLFSNLNASPRIPSMVAQNLDLASIIDQAKINGWYIEPHEIELQEKVGQGSTADIHRGSWRGLDVAVKCIYPNFFHSNDSGTAFFIQEIETLSRQHHPFVLRLMGACLDPPEHAWVVTEIMTMTLKEWLHGYGDRQKERSVLIPPLDVRVMKAMEIAQGMQYLHEQRPKLLHRDLKPSNIFLDDAMHVRVADFGHARFLPDGEKALTGETGTYVYMAPEVIRCEPYTEKCDVYSFGIILNELITGQHPYIETDYGPTKIALEVEEGKLRPKLPEDDDHQLEELIELIQCCWDEDASIRPSFAIITCTLRNIRERF